MTISQQNRSINHVIRKGEGNKTKTSPFDLGCPLFYLRFYTGSTNYPHPDGDQVKKLHTTLQERKKKEEQPQTTQLSFEKSEVNQ